MEDGTGGEGRDGRRDGTGREGRGEMEEMEEMEDGERVIKRDGLGETGNRVQWEEIRGLEWVIREEVCVRYVSRKRKGNTQVHLPHNGMCFVRAVSTLVYM